MENAGAGAARLKGRDVFLVIEEGNVAGLGSIQGRQIAYGLLAVGAGAERRPAKLGQRAQGERPLSGEEPRIGHGRIKAPGPGEGAR